MTDHIERVNRKMFEKIRQTSDYVAVFFCKLIFLKLFFSGGNCHDCLSRLENILLKCDRLFFDKPFSLISKIGSKQSNLFNLGQSVFLVYFHEYAYDLSIGLFFQKKYLILSFEFQDTHNNQRKLFFLKVRVNNTK